EKAYKAVRSWRACIPAARVPSWLRRFAILALCSIERRWPAPSPPNNAATIGRAEVQSNRSIANNRGGPRAGGEEREVDDGGRGPLIHRRSAGKSAYKTRADQSRWL